MDNFDQLVAGDLVSHGTVVFEDTPDYTIYMTRDGDKIIITTEWKNIAAVLDHNRAEANDWSSSGSHGDLVKVASIPQGLYYDWQKQGITEDPEAMRRRLNDSNYAYLRTNNWRI